MSWRIFEVLLRGSIATWMVMALACDTGHAQLIDRAGAETIMRELMPARSRCDQAPWEALSYCRYDSANTSHAVLEVSFGDHGPAASLTYDIGYAEGRQLGNTMQLYWLRVGIPKSALDQCLSQSKWQSSEVMIAGVLLAGVTAANVRMKCRYTDFSGRIGYETFVERIDQSRPVLWDGAGPRASQEQVKTGLQHRAN